ncbi:hypothetical protein [Flammeovirga pacifica]|uniref:DUF4340 domain-containing protein n=1 Tax=Flammeovirga pacifica TaxID=915059 RepID=A0A1S1YZ47_FLAPC|nr:hypothetical protein [Flammeovirga pacifica]OHX66270.1 hypothetical protein NH26_07840 [Flammeovirga pacifica]
MTKKIKILIGVNLCLLAAIGLSFFTFDTSSNEKKGKPFFDLLDLSTVDGFVLNGIKIQREEDGRWLMNDKVDVAPRMIGNIFQAIQQTSIVKQSDATLPTSGVEIKLTTSGATLFEGIISSSGDVATFGEKNGEVYQLEIPGQFINIEQIFDASEKSWRDKTVFRTSWRSMKSFGLHYTMHPENNVDILFKEPFYEVEGISQLDSAATYQFISALPKLQVKEYRDGTLFFQDTVQKFKPFCEIEMFDMVATYNTSFKVFPFDDNVFFYFPLTKEVGVLSPDQVQDMFVSWHFFDANDPRKKSMR